MDDELVPGGTGVSSELISFVILALTLWRDVYRFKDIMEESATPLFPFRCVPQNTEKVEVSCRRYDGVINCNWEWNMSTSNLR